MALILDAKPAGRTRRRRTGTCTISGTSAWEVDVTGAISASEARRSLFPLIERVNQDHTPIEIVSRHGNAVLVSKDDWDAIVETDYLLRTPANARHLAESIDTWRAGKATVRELDLDE
ncbi:type II toxin-antitoxin system prevent-host-death family antitoxin [Dactylosporangium matsuzakiense]|nr:type II toxin-antitoxin system prevent-host-death family antitoxin [Dactylosporangium matsuzakiense]